MPMKRTMRRSQAHNYNNAYASEEPVNAAPGPAGSEPEEETINLTALWKNLKKHMALLIICTLVGGVAAGAFSYFFLPKKYESSATLFLTPTVNEGRAIDYNSLNSNQKLVNNVIYLLTADTTLNPAADRLGIANPEDIKEALTLENTRDTEVIRVKAVTEDPKLSQEMVDTTVTVFIANMEGNLNVSNIRVVDPAMINEEPVSPNILRNTLLGAAAGLLLSLAWVFLRTITDQHLKNREEAEAYLGLPVYAELPVLNVPKHG